MADYKETLNLPKTTFPMKANLPKIEPEILRQWEEKGLYTRILEARKGRPKYILHDGPPYANGSIHIGHALNKILKDIVCRVKTMSGYYVKFVPGWDCHGLPIELQVDRALGRKKAEMDKVEIRRRCREYAMKYVGIQREEFKRLGVFGLWETPYLTMDYGYEATILREFGRFVEKGLVYRGKKPVHWCASCKTALAEAEVEYEEKESPSIYVKFPLISFPEGEPFRDLPDLPWYILIWTTTPWTLPANLAVAVHPEVEYVAVKVKQEGEEEVWLLAKELLEPLTEKFGLRGYSLLATYSGRDLEGITYKHPFLERESKVILGDHVTTDAGTGCVHIAPGHGQEDYELGLKYGLPIFTPVDDRGRFTEEGGEWQGLFVFEANPSIVERLRRDRFLLLAETVHHSYPHCWRCKRPIIFRATEQWFIALDRGDLRERALKEIDKVAWIPSWGRDRIYNMVLHRPDWCISRQRAWGVPIVAFYCKGCDYVLVDRKLIEKVVKIFEEGGAEEWFIKDAKDLLPQGTRCPKCGGTEFKKEEDILDVWFDSGVSFAAVLEEDADLGSPADLYLEGSDQHRGWFHSSLLASVGTRGRAPYRAVLTHGFVVDGEGKKMSKSLGNVISPQDIIREHGAEILRLWVSAEDYKEDMRLSKEILARLVEAYRRIRNTCRFILGNLYDFDPKRDIITYENLREIDKWALTRIGILINRVREAYERFEFHTVYHSIHNFCIVDMSNLYLDILKDRLYTFARDSEERRAAQTALFEILNALVRLIAPVLPFTAEEVWRHMPSFPGKEESVHLALLPEAKEEWLNREITENWDRLLAVRKEVTRVLETARRKEVIGSSLEAQVVLEPQGEVEALLKGYLPFLREVFIVSDVSLGDTGGCRIVMDGESVKGLKVGVDRAKGEKCQRCWNYSERVGEFPSHPDVCERCIEVLQTIGS